jgi:hypothetical protein
MPPIAQAISSTATSRATPPAISHKPMSTPTGTQNSLAHGLMGEAVLAHTAAPPRRLVVTNELDLFMPAALALGNVGTQEVAAVSHTHQVGSDAA